MREDKDLTQEEMAQILHVAQTTYSDYELGKINIPIEVIQGFAVFYRTSIDYLVERTDKTSPMSTALALRGKNG